MAGTTQWLDAQLLTGALGGGITLGATSRRLGLFSTMPTATLPGVEALYPIYSRQLLVLSFNPNATATNTNSVTFVTVTNVTIVGVGVFDNDWPAGSLYFFAPLARSITVGALGSNVVFNPGALSFSIA